MLACASDKFMSTVKYPSDGRNFADVLLTSITIKHAEFLKEMPCPGSVARTPQG